MSQPTTHSSVRFWRRESFLAAAHRVLIIWSLATIVVCGVVKHAFEHRWSSDQESALTRVLRAASGHRIRRLAGTDSYLVDCRLSAQSPILRCRAAFLLAIARW